MKTTCPRNPAATTLAAVDNPLSAPDPSIGIQDSVRTNGISSLCRRLGWVMLSLACFCFLFGDPVLAQKPAPQKAAGGTLTIDPAEMQKPWTGDLDGMIERRVIRVLTVNSKTFYFDDKGTQRGTVVDFFRLFEDELNKKLAAEKKLKNKNLKVRVVFIPMRRDQLLPGLAAGKGDIAAANLTITPERQKLVDFTVAGAEQRERGRGVGAGFTENRQPGRSRRQGSLRAQVLQLLREPGCAQQEVCGREEAAGHAQGSPRDAGGRGSARDAQRRAGRAHRRRQAQGGLLEADLPEAHRARQRRGAHRRRDRVGDSARAARSSRRRWTISSRATRSGPRPATKS